MGLDKFVLVPLVLIPLILGLCESFEFEGKELESKESLWKLYKKWSIHHNISRTPMERFNRFKVFQENAKHVHKVNQMNKSYKLKLNRFGDMSNSEFANLYANSNINYYRNLKKTRKAGGSGGGSGKGFMYEQVLNLPPSIDWRAMGAVTGVKSQDLGAIGCGCCWAFSAIGAVEGINQIRTKQLVPLSEQELVDCDQMDGGCGGGYMETAFDFIRQNGGITTEANYPYNAKQGYCTSSSSRMNLVTIDGYQNVPPYNEDALMQAVANQPVSVALEGSGLDFQFYGGGVFNGNCGVVLNHAVVAVGYGPDYWIMKNSWGAGWGEGGYVRMQRGANPPAGLCGIAIDASFPIKY